MNESEGSERPKAYGEGEVIDDPNYPPSAHLRAVYEEISKRIELQRTQLDDLQRLVAIVLTANGVFLGLVAGINVGRAFPPLAFWTLLAAVGVLSINVIVGGAALWPRALEAPGEVESLFADYLRAPANVMFYDLIRAARQAYLDNEALGVRRRRSQLVRTQLTLLSVGAFLVLVTFALRGRL